MPANFTKLQKGFTLLEMIAGIVIFAVALVALTSVFIPQARQGIDPIWQVRAVKLGESLLSEINAKAFDEISITTGLNQRCNDLIPCTLSAALGPELGESRALFDDVDDYDGLNLSGSQIVGLLGGTIDYLGEDVYEGFSASINVFYDANQDGINDDDADANGILDSGIVTSNKKLILVTITTPDDQALQFASFRDNY